MSGIVVKTKSRKEAEWLLDIIKKMQFSGRVLSLPELEDLALASAIEEGRNTKKVNKSVIEKMLK